MKEKASSRGIRRDSVLCEKLNHMSMITVMRRLRISHDILEGKLHEGRTLFCFLLCSQHMAHSRYSVNGCPMCSCIIYKLKMSITVCWKTVGIVSLTKRSPVISHLWAIWRLQVFSGALAPFISLTVPSKNWSPGALELSAVLLLAHPCSRQGDGKDRWYSFKTSLPEVPHCNVLLIRIVSPAYMIQEKLGNVVDVCIIIVSRIG